MLAVRSTEAAARTSGISPSRAKISIFALSAAIAGFGGAMLGMVNFSITKSTAPPLIGLIWLAVAVTFGVRRPGGALLAGLAFACSQTVLKWIGDDFIGGDFAEVTSNTTFVSILFGLGAINLAKNPDGLLALIGHRRLERRRAKQRQGVIDEAEAEAHDGTVPEHERIHTSVAALAPGGDAPVADAGAPVVPAAPDAPDAPDSPDLPDSVRGPDLALSIRGVVAGYGDVEVLHGVDLDVPTGSVVALLGANGAGKSTLCSVAAGLLEPTAGSVVLDGADVTTHAVYRRQRDGILLVPEARGIFPGLTVDENLAILLKRDAERTKAYDRFPILGERRTQLAGSLSGGEQQMLSLAPALAQPPKVFIADEPTLGLAPLAAEEVVRALRELRELGSAILLVDEKAREAMELADAIAFLELGRVVWSGPRDEVDEDRLAASYLGGGARG
jgi:ABC-type branched-subunit amino acid transport system ATPase component